jgi:hypothetical protein
MPKKAICPICSKKHNVQSDQWLVNGTIPRAAQWSFAFIGYRTWFYCDAYAERAYIFKWYDMNYEYICYTVSHMLMSTRG